jgi:pfkB family carbohydrate kinase
LINTFSVMLRGYRLKPRFQSYTIRRKVLRWGHRKCSSKYCRAWRRGAAGSVIGDDGAGDFIAGPLTESEGIDGRFIRAPGHPTTTKVRFVAGGGQQIMRLDIERKLQLDAGQMDAISDWLQEADKVEAIVLSDYAKGVLTPTVIRRVISIAQSRRIPVVVDPKSQEAAARILREKAQVRAVVLTRGAQGHRQVKCALS